jgi:hypothetical protein
MHVSLSRTRRDPERPGHCMPDDTIPQRGLTRAVFLPSITARRSASRSGRRAASASIVFSAGFLSSLSPPRAGCPSVERRDQWAVGGHGPAPGASTAGRCGGPEPSPGRPDAALNPDHEAEALGMGQSVADGPDATSGPLTRWPAGPAGLDEAANRAV